MTKFKIVSTLHWTKCRHSEYTWTMVGTIKTNRRHREPLIEKEPLKKIRKRRRCQNCNKLYRPVRDDQKFCRDNDDPDKCRKEFYRYGSSYGPLRTGLHNAIDKKYAELKRQIEARMLTLSAMIGELSARVDQLTVERSTPDAKTQAG